MLACGTDMSSVAQQAERSGEAQTKDALRRYTYAELCAEFPETNQLSELWEGELIVLPAPSFYHQEIVGRFCRALYDWVHLRKLGETVTAPIDLVLSEHFVAQPDVVFIAQERLGIIRRVIMGPADLAAEVISLGGRNRDRILKRDLYEQYGVKEYWIIDPEAETAEVLALEQGTYRLVMRCGVEQTAESRLLPGFTIEMRQLFHGE